MATNKKIATISAKGRAYLLQSKAATTEKETVWLNAYDLAARRYIGDGVEVYGFFKKHADSLAVAKLRPKFAQLDEKGKPLPAIDVEKNHAAAVEAAVIAIAKAKGWTYMPTLAKHMADDIVMFWMGDRESFRKALTWWTGNPISDDDVTWIQLNMEKGFKALSASTLAKSELDEKIDSFIVVLPSIGIAMDGAGVCSDRHPIMTMKDGMVTDVDGNESFIDMVKLGEGCQIRGNVRKLNPNSPWDVPFNYLKGVIWSLKGDHVLAAFDALWEANANNPKRDAMDYAKVRNWLADHVHNTIVTTTDVAKRASVGVFRTTHLAINYYGHKKEGKKIAASSQVYMRNDAYTAGNGKTAAAVARKVNILIDLTEWCLAHWSEKARIKLLRAFDRYADDVTDEEVADTADEACMTSNFDEVHARLREEGISLEALNYEGKLASACHTLVSKALRTKPNRAYRMYNLPSFLVEVVSGQKMAEGDIYMPEDVWSILGVKPGDWVLSGRDPRLAHSLMPHKVSPIVTYLRGLSEKAMILGGFNTDGLRDQSDYDGDARVAMNPKFIRGMDFEAAIAAARADLTELVAWLKAGADISKLPLWEEMKEVATFTLPGMSDLARAIFGTLYAAKGIEKGDSIATSMAFCFAKMVPWFMVVIIQKVIESVKHSAADSVFVNIDRISSFFRAKESGFFFALKSKKEGSEQQAVAFRTRYAEKGAVSDSKLLAYAKQFVSETSWPLLETAIRWSFAAEKLVAIAPSGSAYFAQPPVVDHAEIIYWLFGDKRVAAMAGAVDPNTGTDYVLGGDIRFMHEYLDAKQYQAEVLSKYTDASTVEASNCIAAAAAAVRLAKDTIKNRISLLADAIAFCGKNRFYIADPEQKTFRGFTNSIFDEKSKKNFVNTVHPLGMSIPEGKAGDQFWYMSTKMGKYYRLWNAWIQDCATKENPEDAALEHIIRAIFVAGHTLGANGLPMKDYLYFIGENVCVDLRKDYALRGYKVAYFTAAEERAIRSKRRTYFKQEIQE